METEKRIPESWISQSGIVLYLLSGAEGYRAAYVTSNVTDLTGYSAEEALLPGWWAGNLHPDDRPRLLYVGRLAPIKGLSHAWRSSAAAAS